MTFKPKMDLTGLTAEQRVWAERLAAHLAFYGKHNPEPDPEPDYAAIHRRRRKRTPKQTKIPLK